MVKINMCIRKIDRSITRKKFRILTESHIIEQLHAELLNFLQTSIE